MSEGGSSPDTSIDDLGAVPPIDSQLEVESTDTPSRQPTANGQDTSSKAVAADEPADEPWRKRLWFVRLPAPEKVSAGGLKANLESLKDQVKLLNASAQVKRLERDQAQQLHKQARAQLLICKENLQQKDEQLRPLREARDERNKAQEALRSSKGELPVKNEEELDARLKELHHRQQHESMSANSEKQLLQQIKALQASRERVREYAAKASTLTTARAAMSSVQGELQALQADYRQLADERQVQSKITEKYWGDQQQLDGQIEGIFKERRRIKELQDEVYNEYKAHEQEQRQRSGAYQRNRTFSQQVRKVLRSGQLEEARAMCDQQMDEAIEHLSTDAGARAEYLALWEQQRPRKLEPPPRSSTQAQPEAEQSSKSKATDAIHRALQHAAQQLARRPDDTNGNPPVARAATRGTSVTLPSGELPAPVNAPSAKPEQVRKPSPVKAASPVKTRPVAPPAGPQQEQPQQQQTQDEQPEQNGDAAAVKPAGKGRRYEPDDFKVPASLQKSEATVNEEQKREQARQHNLAAAREAEARKLRKAQEKERKARALEAKATAKSQAPQPEPAANGFASLADQDLASPPEPMIPSQEFLLAAAAEAKKPSVLKSRAQQRKPGAGKGSKIAPSAPKARPPVRRKGLARFLREYQWYLAGGGAALVTAAVGAYVAYGTNLL